MATVRVQRKNMADVILRGIEPELLMAFKNLSEKDLKVILTSRSEALYNTARFALSLHEEIKKAVLSRGKKQVRIKFEKKKGEVSKTQAH